MGGGGILIDVILTHSGRAILRYVNSFNSWFGGKCKANITILTWYNLGGGGGKKKKIKKKYIFLQKQIQRGENL